VLGVQNQRIVPPSDDRRFEEALICFMPPTVAATCELNCGLDGTEAGDANAHDLRHAPLLGLRRILSPF